LGSELDSEEPAVYSWDVKDSTGTYTTGADDLSLVETVWNAIKDDARIDTARVYACGHSVGSLFISNELAPLTNFFAGHLCLSSQLMTTTDISTAQVPINVVTIHGKGDKLIPYLGGPASFNANIIFRSEVDTLSAWSQHNGCGGSLTTSTGAFDYTFAAKGSTMQQTVVANWTKYESPCTAGRVCGYILSSPSASNSLVDDIQHNTIDPAMQLFGVSNTAALVLAVFEGELI
jgi:poly(3-hydroxybutyrate) depolymerase